MFEMKKLLHIILMVLGAGCVSCSVGDVFLDSPDNYESSTPIDATIIATVKQDEGGVYLWSKGERLNPVKSIDFSRQQRVMASVTKYFREESVYSADIHWMEPLDEGNFTYSASAPGSDPLDVNTSSWMTGVDDGYLTLSYVAKWGEHPLHHDFYLVAGLDKNDPYSLELRHNANGDKAFESAEGLICFDINSLPDTVGESKTITIKWKNTEGKTSITKFEFTSRK